MCVCERESEQDNWTGKIQVHAEVRERGKSSCQVCEVKKRVGLFV